ncbi:hypothetical protein SAMN05421736_13217 [Evansella caseinilytica]|uniref:Uncharacterized protein n=1 Tax=Evansella caseinilytica TaxID=1503961 RepID=A0A1H3V2C1_9BACI|nr:hypothetical protein SAMN05421736_13217 [Evansella caseinilytica]
MFGLSVHHPALDLIRFTGILVMVQEHKDLMGLGKQPAEVFLILIGVTTMFALILKGHELRIGSIFQNGEPEG